MDKIELFLLDGTSNGRWICEVSGWSGKVFKIPRTRIRESESRDELKKPGVYFLFEKDETPEKPLVYIGESDEVIERLKAHLSEQKADFKDWNEAIVFVTTNSNLNKGHIKYLERRFYDIAKDCNRYRVSNKNKPTKSPISEADRAAFETFIDHLKTLVNVLGHKAFEPYAQTYAEEEAIVFYGKVGNGKAQGILNSQGFVLLKGSSINTDSRPSLNNGIKRIVKAGLANGQILNNILQEDILFSSPSRAAQFAYGSPTSGLTYWKTQDKETLKSFEARIAKKQ